MVAMCEDHARLQLEHLNKASTLMVKYFNFLWSVQLTIMPFPSKAAVMILFSLASLMT